MKWHKWIGIIGLMVVVASSAWAADGGKDEDSYAYFGLEPDIVTNFITQTKNLGYIRTAVELRVYHKSRLEAVKHNSPLLRDAIIEILGSQDSEQIRSQQGRENIRKLCLKTINNLLLQETGEKDVVADLIFTKYLYQ